jgi:Spy/CpxP family protein refolding chaperone
MENRFRNVWKSGKMENTMKKIQSTNRQWKKIYEIREGQRNVQRKDKKTKKVRKFWEERKKYG